MQTPLHPAFIDPHKRTAGDGDMQLIVATWDHVGTGERPLAEHPGWAIVDRVDIADLASERDHAWHGRLGERALGDKTAKWSFVMRQVRQTGLVIDGGRTIRDGGETFTIGGDPAKPTRLVLRTGGERAMQFGNGTIDHPVKITVLAGDAEVATRHDPGARWRVRRAPGRVAGGRVARAAHRGEWLVPRVPLVRAATRVALAQTSLTAAREA